ncbi:hypothetical protein RJ640_025495 [Escallonia rubra]|uniref:Uncharacterized protein n=1 Tax=Escallonia rubra TaxID=112253 RepID=A0AA88QLF6_9ASTE|nr:hypothetical protein RJ640_025495 [Escallonia rubra]
MTEESTHHARGQPCVAKHSVGSPRRPAPDVVVQQPHQVIRRREGDDNNNNLSVEIDEEPDLSDSRKIRRTDDDLNSQADNCNDDSSARNTAAVKRPRLVWTLQLHKRFVDVVAHLGIKNAISIINGDWDGREEWEFVAIRRGDSDVSSNFVG